MKNKRIAIVSVLLSLALIVGVIEAKTPPVIPMVPYVKIGFSNIVVLATIYITNVWIALFIVIAKSLIVAAFSGQVMALAYSLSAGILSYICMLLLLKVKIFSLPSISSISGLVHNLVQITVAGIILKNFGIYHYFAYLAIFGMVAGFLVGIIAFYLLKALPERYFEYFRKKEVSSRQE